MTYEKNFLAGKKTALSKLNKAQKEKKVDLGILPILDIINKSEDYYTSSSCYGRTVLLEIPKIGNKKEAKFLGKWHREIKVDEIISASKNAKKGQLWLLSQSTIIHIIAKTNEVAEKMLKTAISSGFKNSGLKSFGKKIVIEICSTERLDSPIGKDGLILCDKKYLDLLTNISNEIIIKSSMKIEKFKKNLEQLI